MREETVPLPVDILLGLTLGVLAGAVGIIIGAMLR